MKYKDEVWAVIPARSGSKGLKNKNIKTLFNKPLLAHSIISAKKNNLIVYGRMLLAKGLLTTKSKLSNEFGKLDPRYNQEITNKILDLKCKIVI